MNFPLKHMTVGRRGGYLNKSGVQSRGVMWNEPPTVSATLCAAWVLMVEAFISRGDESHFLMGLKWYIEGRFE